MSVPIKPHQFRIFSQSPRIATDNVVEGFSPDTPGILVRGCAQQLSPNASYDAFGREVSNGMAFYVDITQINLSTLEVGGTIEWNGNLHMIEKVQTNEQNIATDHIAVYAVQARY